MNTLKLNKLNANQLTKEQMREIVGGENPHTCTCGCCYANDGGSNTSDNGIANYESRLQTGCDVTWVMD